MSLETLSHPVPHPLRAVRLAEQGTVQLLGRLSSPRRGGADLGEQARRAAVSVTLNLVEGHALRGGARRRHWRAAHGSCQELKSALRMLMALGLLEREAGEALLRYFDEVGRMVWGLLQKPGR